MEGKATSITTLADFIDGGRPFTASVSLNPGRPSSAPKTQQSSPQIRRQHVDDATPPSPLSKTLKPFSEPTVLLGKITLPSSCSDATDCSCFRFTDGTGVVCCDILDFDADVIGRDIRILSWNFIPIKCGDGRRKSGFLEIVRWVFDELRGVDICSLSNFSSCCLKMGGMKCDNIVKSVVFGVVKAISPVTVVPCGDDGAAVTDVRAFLADVFVCECVLCSKSRVSGFTKDNLKDHNFAKKAVVFLSGSRSSWHLLFYRLIGRVILLMGMKKKLVYIGKQEPQLMHVTTDDSSLHVHRFVEIPILKCNKGVRGEQKFGSYTGVVMDVYMQGAVVELDKEVMLLLTDQYLTVPHSLRVGAIVTFRNIHLVDTQFSWRKILILGACCMTNVHVESFSPLETGCYLKSHSKSILQKFIDSLAFSARLWVLLLIVCFRRKFSGILSEKEILGSNHKEGLAQKYASIHLPKSAFYSRHGVMSEFCWHDACSAIKEVNCGQLRLAIPISNIIAYCETSWEKKFGSKGHLADPTCGVDQGKNISCNGKSYEQPIQRILSSEDNGIVALGQLKVSLSSGRLQLVDATAAVDVMFRIPPNWKFENIFEAKDFTIIMQGIAPKLVDMKSVMDPLSCKSILGNTLVIERTRISLSLYENPGSGNSRSCSPFHLEDYTQKLAHGKYKLLMVTHKFPIQQRFEGDRANRLNLFAEAIILPWSLLVAEGLEDAMLSVASLEHLRDSLQKFATSEEHALKKCKVDHGLRSVSLNSSSHSNAEDIRCFSSEFPCLIAHRNFSHHIPGILHCTIDCIEMINISNSPSRRLLLEFDPNSFCTFELLKIGGYYLLKEEEDKSGPRIFHDKVFVSSETHLWSFVFSSLHGSDASDMSKKDSLKASNEILMNNNVKEDDIPWGLKLYLPSSALSSVADVIKILENKEPLTTPKDTHDYCSGTMMIMPEHGLPVGDLISLHGLVIAIHDTVTDDFPENSSLPKFLRRDKNVCIHVLVDNHVVKISGKRAYPIGLGPNVYATFHRVFKPRGHDKYTLMPTSFISVKHTSLMKNQCGDEFNHPYKPLLGLPAVTSPKTNPIISSLVSNAMHSSESNQTMQLRCRVVSVYIVVLEKIGTTNTFSPSSSNSTVRIPFAGFVLDDGSPSCRCCWADSYIAATLLSVNDGSPSSTKTLLQEKRGTIHRLNQILERHGRFVIRNYGSMFDSSNQNVEISFGSDKFVLTSDSDFLRELIINASSLSNIWTVSACFMDESATKRLRQQLTEVDMMMPSICNLQITSVRSANILEQARDLFRDLNK